METETRVTSKTGGQKGQKQGRLGGADPLAMMELAKVYGFGEEKYARFNYLRGYDWSLSIDALNRHLWAFLGGEDNDPESGLNHMAHVAWHALTLCAYSMRGLGVDDRYHAPEPEPYDPNTLTFALDDPWVTRSEAESMLFDVYSGRGKGGEL